MFALCTGIPTNISRLIYILKLIVRYKSKYKYFLCSYLSGLLYRIRTFRGGLFKKSKLAQQELQANAGTNIFKKLSWEKNFKHEFEFLP